MGLMQQIRKKAKTEELDYLFLMGCLSSYKNIHPEEIMKIRFEIDTDPPSDGAQTENATLLLPYPFSVKTLRLEDLFAGKVHATLCREWKGRVKGRDWYDVIWFLFFLKKSKS